MAVPTVIHFSKIAAAPLAYPSPLAYSDQHEVPEGSVFEANSVCHFQPRFEDLIESQCVTRSISSVAP